MSDDSVENGPPASQAAVGQPAQLSGLHAQALDTRTSDGGTVLGLGEYPANVPRNLDYPNIPASGLLARAAAALPDRVAATCLNRDLTYAQADRAATHLAMWLQQHGVGCGDRVGVLLPNTPETLIALNGIWRAGGVVVAMSPLATAEELAGLVRLTDCRTVVCLDVLTGLLRESPEFEQTLLTSLVDYLPSWKRLGYLAARWQRTGKLLHTADAHHQWFWDAIESTAHFNRRRLCDVDAGGMPTKHRSRIHPKYGRNDG